MISITLIIVIITCVISFSSFSNQKYVDDMIFYPPAISRRNQYYRFVTHALIHADITHLAFNMISLYFFGGLVEKYMYTNECIFGNMGKLIYILMYLSAAAVASIPTYLQHKDDYHYRSLGASGAVSAVIFAGLTLMPQIPINFLFIPIDIPGYIFGPIYLGASYYLSRKGTDNINHSAHYWGAIYGIVFTVVLCLVLGKINLWDNFVNQIKAYPYILPFYCE
jgi:membrane associated rhomboid family serine protease